jgi:hypothetical protein
MVTRAVAAAHRSVTTPLQSDKDENSGVSGGKGEGQAAEGVDRSELEQLPGYRTQQLDHNTGRGAT